jgi:hypothetical protein
MIHRQKRDVVYVSGKSQEDSGRAAVESRSLRDLRVPEMTRLVEGKSNPMYRQSWK